MAFADISSLVRTSRPALPQIYAYTTPEIARHDGWTKIGYTEQNVETRLKQQTATCASSTSRACPAPSGSR